MLISVFLNGALLIQTYAQPNQKDHSSKSNSRVQETVYYNTKSKAFHKFSCIWAKKCTKNCIPLDKKEAMFEGRPCKFCGG